MANASHVFGRQPRQQSKLYRPHISQVLAAVRSLYADRLKPLGRIILKRLREMEAEASGGTLSLDDIPLIDPKVLRNICASHPELVVEAEEAKEYCVLFRRVPGDFIDVRSTEDPYPEPLWDAIANYLASLTPPHHAFPGGRYACAKELISRNLAILQGMAFGQVCHLVQLAISQRQLLGYFEGKIVPFQCSEDCIKLRCADRHVPVSHSRRAPEPGVRLATWEDVYYCIQNHFHLCSRRGQLCSLTLSNVKRVFRTSFNLELSETSLGYSRLHEVLCDKRLAGICRVVTRDGNQVLVPCDSRGQTAQVSVAAGPLSSGYAPAAPGAWWPQGDAFGGPTDNRAPNGYCPPPRANYFPWLHSHEADDNESGPPGGHRLRSLLQQQLPPSAGELSGGDRKQHHAFSGAPQFGRQQPQMPPRRGSLPNEVGLFPPHGSYQDFSGPQERASQLAPTAPAGRPGQVQPAPLGPQGAWAAGRMAELGQLDQPAASRSDGDSIVFYQTVSF